MTRLASARSAKQRRPTDDESIGGYKSLSAKNRDRSASFKEETITSKEKEKTMFDAAQTPTFWLWRSVATRLRRKWMLAGGKAGLDNK
ncbi:hypothetical protein GN244_ATG12860 [Phytophthora infestans]|uniref:Uncharacterized protein n=1 Tax=Phytophthora infestans TaxID=4787 RepID=A0A833WHK0_PHYIN|nr:hypothetical protein GN244_ATG12860 [Phytophthora infestans]KAF4134737.1 hypothetical protein GN958_ATG15993 [Phytophthora infestans]